MRQYKKDIYILRTITPKVDIIDIDMIKLRKTQIDIIEENEK